MDAREQFQKRRSLESLRHLVLGTHVSRCAYNRICQQHLRHKRLSTKAQIRLSDPGQVRRPKFDCLIALTPPWCVSDSSETGLFVASGWGRWFSSSGKGFALSPSPCVDLQRFDSSWMSVSSSLPVVTSRRNASRCQNGRPDDHSRISLRTLTLAMHTSEFSIDGPEHSGR